MVNRKLEYEVLKPRNPAIVSENDWPEFQLRNVEVKDREGNFFNLLHVDAVTPVTVTGDLVLLDETHQYLLPDGKSKDKRPLQLPIRVNNVTHFSYGAYESGEVDIWAAGDSGWYRLQPAREYILMFEDMKKAVKLFYYVADAYVEHPKLAVSKLFEEYALANKYKGAESGKKMILEHKRFLLSRMENGAEGIKWSQMPIYDYLHSPRSEVQRTAKPSTAQLPRKSQIMAARTPVLRDRRTSRRPQRGEAVSGDDETKPHNGSLYRSGHAPYQLSQEEVKAKVNALWTILQNAANYENILTTFTLSRAVYQYLTFDDEIQASEYILFFAPEIVTKIQRKHSGKQRWIESFFYSDLLNTELSRSTKAKIAQMKVHKRDQAVQLPPLNDDKDTSSEDELHHTRQSRHVKGGLRPKGKGAAKKSKSYTGPAHRYSMDIDATSEASNPRKRKRTPDSPSFPKQARSKAMSDATTSLSQDHDFAAYGSDEGEDENAFQRSTELTSPPSFGRKAETTLAVLSTLSHDPSPNAPGDRYNCPHFGCNHVVYAASSDLGQELISEHLAEHDDKMRVIVNEKHLTHLPVGNLIKRIREMAAFEGSDGFQCGVLAGRQTVERAFPA